MASIIYGNFFQDVLKGNIDTDVDTFKVAALTSAYTENQDTHAKRSDLTNEVAAGGGYTTGGMAVTVGISYDSTNNRVELSLGGGTWAAATFTARKFAYYKSRGGAASADELVAVIDHGSDVVATGGNFDLAASTLRIQL